MFPLMGRQVHIDHSTCLIPTECASHWFVAFKPQCQDTKEVSLVAVAADACQQPSLLGHDVPEAAKAAVSTEQDGHGASSANGAAQNQGDRHGKLSETADLEEGKDAGLQDAEAEGKKGNENAAEQKHDGDHAMTQAKATEAQEEKAHEEKAVPDDKKPSCLKKVGQEGKGSKKTVVITGP